jgi:hypothetical protein
MILKFVNELSEHKHRFKNVDFRIIVHEPLVDDVYTVDCLFRVEQGLLCQTLKVSKEAMDEEENTILEYLCGTSWEWYKVKYKDQNIEKR